MATFTKKMSSLPKPKQRIGYADSRMICDHLHNMNPVPVDTAVMQYGEDILDAGLMCVYCRVAIATEWDHYYPLIRDGCATGYGYDSANMVRACKKCNDSKGSSLPFEWKKGKHYFEEPMWKEFAQFHRIHAVYREFIIDEFKFAKEQIEQFNATLIGQLAETHAKRTANV